MLFRSTKAATLPGGDFPVTGFSAQVADLRRGYSFLSESAAARLVRLYGTRARNLLGSAKTPESLGAKFGPVVTEAEVSYLMAHEWAMTAEDVLWRRTKAGLVTSKPDAEALDKFMASARN